MAVAGVSMVKDEADIIVGTLMHMSLEVDFLVVADNGSTDGTREILAELADKLPLTVVDDHDIAYRQSEKMTALAARAASIGATWIVPFDADELWVWHGDRISVDLPALDGVNVVTAELFNHFPTAVDPDGIDPFTTIIWRQQKPAPLPKVAFRWHPDAVVHQGNHGVTIPGSQRNAPGMEVRHFPYRSPDQFVRKARNGAAAYRATDLPASVGAHWRSYGDLLDRHGPEVLHDVFREHFWFLSPADAGLTPDPAPYMRWTE